MRRRPVRFCHLAVLTLVAAGVLAGCGSGGGSSGSGNSKNPIVIGTSLSLSGDFSVDGAAFQRGYNLWISDINSSGGLLGRKVKLTVVNDNSSPTQVVSNYQKLISVNHVDLVFGPYSSLLTGPASSAVARYGYAMVEGAGGAPAVFNTPSNKAYHNVFDVSLPIKNYLVPFANWIASLPPSQRPKTAAYPAVDGPFTVPPVQQAQAVLSRAGVKTVYSKIFPEEVPDYKPAADNVAASGADMVVLGGSDVPTVGAFMKAFQQQHYNPKVFISTAGPDQGGAFLSAVGKDNATGIMTPNGWYGDYNNAQSKKMVQEYIAKYGGTPSEINSDVAEGYAVGQVVAAAVKATNSVDNAKIIKYLHSGVTIQTVQGPVKFDSLGQSAETIMFIFQWQNGKYVQVLPKTAPGSMPIIYPKPAWAG
ncbi:MAG: amino acid ABC transporter substrate-binding protein [Micromonosporaceae bacterium]